MYLTLMIVNFPIGIEHNVSFAFCQCEPLTVTMVKVRLWPSSPHQPNVAFTFDFLYWKVYNDLICIISPVL